MKCPDLNRCPYFRDSFITCNNYMLLSVAGPRGSVLVRNKGVIILIEGILIITQD